MEFVNKLNLGFNDKERLPDRQQVSSIHYIPIESGTGEILLFVESEACVNLTVYAGNTVFAGKDLVVEFDSMDIHVYRLEVAPYMIQNGEGRNHIKIKADEEITLSVIELK